MSEPELRWHIPPARGTASGGSHTPSVLTASPAAEVHERGDFIAGPASLRCNPFLPNEPWASAAGIEVGALGKRGMDIAIASLLLGLFTPVMIAAAILVWLTSPGRVLFRQVRVGQHERTFQMYKFRTMREGTDDRALRELNTRELRGDRRAGTSDGKFKIEGDPRVTAVGRWLRRFSIDELPQLFNVLRGEMSLIGPRPSLPWEVALYTSAQRRRHACRPGMTGLWQVCGRSALSMPEMLELDVLYARSRTLRLDLWILWRTPSAVLFDRSVR
jgi:lipopolysaccharide/colanic/teichoic acid biosynthesis glycosyltransferase